MKKADFAPRIQGDAHCPGDSYDAALCQHRADALGDTQVAINQLQEALRCPVANQ